MRRNQQSFLLVIILLFFFARSSYGQESTYFNYNEQNILPSSEVYHIHQDRSGFIWFATDNGVVRFDGADFLTYNKSNGLADAVVFGIHEDVKGNLYFRTFTGAVSIYAQGEMRPYPYNDLVKSTLQNALISSLTMDSLGTLHFATSASIGKIVAIDRDGKVNSTTYNRPTLFIKQIGKTLLIGRSSTPGSIADVSIDGKKYKISRHDSSENSSVVCSAYWGKNLYFSKDHYLYTYDGHSVRLVKRFENAIISISLDRSDHLWIGQMNGGVEKFSDSSFQQGAKIPLLQKLSVTTVLEDKEGGLWFSTLERGVFYIPNLEVENFLYPPYAKINAVVASDDLVFLGFYNGKITAIDIASRKEVWSLDLKYPVMSAFYDQYKKELWVSTNSNSKVISPQGKLLHEIPDVKSVKKFFRFADQQIGAINVFGVYQVDAQRNLKLVKAFDFWVRNIQVTDQAAYVAGISGLYRTDLNFSSLQPIREFDNLKVSTIEVLPSKEILVASIGNGIRILSEGGKPRVPFQNEFLFENAYQVWIDSCLWIASEKGLFKTPTSGLARNQVMQFDFIDKYTGILSNKVNFIWRFKEETWCFLGDGFSILKNNKMKFANKKPQTYIKNIYINQAKVPDTPLYDLPYDKNNIRISLGFIAFNNRNIILRHRISHSNGDWNYSRATAMDYFSLNPGRYKWDIQFSPDYTSWNKIDFPHTFEINPAWWESNYFKALILLLTVSAIYVFFRIQYNRKFLRLEMQNKLRSEKERIARDLHDNIGSKLVSLSLGLDSMTKNDSNIRVTPAMLIENVNSTVTELRDTIWVIQKEDITLTEFTDKLDNLIWRLQQQQENRDFQIFIDSMNGFENYKFSPLITINLFRIIQEIMANCQKHSRASTIQIRLGLDRLTSSLRIEIEDNGVGFDLEKVMQNGHYGLTNIKLRSTEIGAKINIQSGLGKGTTVLLEVALNGQ